jgi:hypothetical protein
MNVGNVGKEVILRCVGEEIIEPAGHIHIVVAYALNRAGLADYHILFAIAAANDLGPGRHIVWSGGWICSLSFIGA